MQGKWKQYSNQNQDRGDGPICGSFWRWRQNRGFTGSWRIFFIEDVTEWDRAVMSIGNRPQGGGIGSAIGCGRDKIGRGGYG